jgi:hypothetical protein
MVSPTEKEPNMNVETARQALALEAMLTAGELPQHVGQIWRPDGKGGIKQHLVPDPAAVDLPGGGVATIRGIKANARKARKVLGL